MEWRESILNALDGFSPNEKASIISQLNEANVGWKLFVDIPDKESKALIIGDELGTKGAIFCTSFKSVAILESDPIKMSFFKIRKKQFKLKNLTLITGKVDRSLPFCDEVFSTVIITPYINYLPKSVIKDVLYEVYRVIKEDGTFILWVENRFSYLRLKSLTKRHESFFEKSCYSLNGYLKLLEMAGFKSVNTYIALPEYNFTREIVELSNDRENRRISMTSWRNKLKTNKYLASNLGIVSSKDDYDRSIINNIISEIRKNIDTQDHEDLFAKNHFMTPKGNFILILSYKNSLKNGYIVKIPITFIAEKHDRHNYQALNNIHKNKNISQEIRSMIPKPINDGNYNGQLFFVEERKIGKSHRDIGKEPEVINDILKSGLDFITKLHKETAMEASFTEDRFRNIIGAKLDHIESIWCSDFNLVIKKIYSYLANGLIGQNIPLVRKHGDYSIANIIIKKRSNTINGIIDWDLSEEEYLPLIDLLNLIESSYNVFWDWDLGKTVCKIFLGEQLPAHFRFLIDRYLEEFGLNQNMLRLMVIVYWIDHVNSQLQYPFLQYNKDWININVIEVLKCLEKII